MVVNGPNISFCQLPDSNHGFLLTLPTVRCAILSVRDMAGAYVYLKQNIHLLFGGE